MITFNNIGYFGRLGNQMFQYAALVGIATKKGFEYGIPHKNALVKKVVNRVTGEEKLDLLDFFKNIKAKNVTEPNEKTIYYDRACKYEPGFFDVVEDGMDILGYFQSEKYFLHCEKEIREQFAFDEKEHMFAWHHVNKGTYDNPICVHVRRGDYAHYNGIHDFPGKDYYHEAMKEFPDGRFVFYSDDLDWCREEFPGHDYVDKKNPYQALKSMSCCRGHIIANSSFSWWAAWLRGKNGKTVAPSKWFGPKGQQDWQDIYCEGWKVI
tara:strand:+ start:409 stop:1206 length:798 start_codon:yes stop_codon:yes gene_type:complete